MKNRRVLVVAGVLLISAGALLGLTSTAFTWGASIRRPAA